MASKRTVTKSRAPVGGRRKPTRPAHDLDDFASGMGNETSDDNDVHIVFLEGGGALFVPHGGGEALCTIVGVILVAVGHGLNRRALA